MAEHHALGRARGAARVGDRGQRVLADAGWLHRLARRARPRPPRAPRSAPAAAPRDRQPLGVGHQQLDAGVVDHERQLVLGQPMVEAHEHAARGGHAQPALEVRERVAAEEPDPPLLERAERRDPPRELAIRHRARPVDDRDLVAVHERRARQRPAQVAHSPSSRAAFSLSTSGRTSSRIGSCLEVAQPAVRGDQREVRAEQHLVLELGVRVADQVLREVLRRPAGEVDVDVRLVDRDRQRLVLPRERRVGEDDVQLREVGRDVVDRHRVGVLQPHAAAAGHARADPGRAGMEQRDQPGLGDHLVQRVEGAVVGPEGLRVGVELEPARAALHPLARLAHAELALVRVDATRTGSARPGWPPRPPAPRRCRAAGGPSRPRRRR